MLPITAAVDRFAPPQQNRPMNCKSLTRIATLLAIAFIPLVHAEDSGGPQRRLYVAVPGIRNYLQYGGHGVLVFDINNGHRFLRRIPAGGIGKDGKPMNVKGICACAATARLYVSTLETMQCDCKNGQR